LAFARLSMVCTAHFGAHLALIDCQRARSTFNHWCATAL
jgi:hypothetical protein